MFYRWNKYWAHWFDKRERKNHFKIVQIDIIMWWVSLALVSGSALFSIPVLATLNSYYNQFCGCRVFVWAAVDISALSAQLGPARRGPGRLCQVSPSPPGAAHPATDIPSTREDWAVSTLHSAPSPSYTQNTNWIVLWSIINQLHFPAHKPMKHKRHRIKYLHLIKCNSNWYYYTVEMSFKRREKLNPGLYALLRHFVYNSLYFSVWEGSGVGTLRRLWGWGQPKPG